MSTNFKTYENPSIFHRWAAAQWRRPKDPTIYGATDEMGHKAVENRVSVHDFHATILHQLGMNNRDLFFEHPYGALQVWVLTFSSVHAAGLLTSSSVDGGASVGTHMSQHRHVFPGIQHRVAPTIKTLSRSSSPDE